MSTAPATWRRIAWIVALWLAALGMLVARSKWLHWLAASEYDVYIHDGAYLVASYRGRFWSVLIPLFIVSGALVLQYRWFLGAARGAAQIGLFILPFAYLVGLLIGDGGGANPIAYVELRDGHRFVLAVEPIPTDVVYTLFEVEGPFGLYWRHTETGLDYSEDGRFVGDERLVVSRDERWLMVTRAGVWTDCFHLVGHRPIRVDVQPYANWNSADYEVNMRLRSARISALTGLRP